VYGVEDLFVMIVKPIGKNAYSNNIKYQNAENQKKPFPYGVIVFEYFQNIQK
jgi:hypothetical protein